MNENIDLTKILKDCPEGTEFYSSICGKVIFKGIIENNLYPIMTNKATYTKEGKLYIGQGECTIFPSKEQRDWSKFVPTWKQTKSKVKVIVYPFDRMLYRHTPEMNWRGTIIANYDNMCLSSVYIPYNKDTAHLLGTNDDCPIDYEIEFSKDYKE